MKEAAELDDTILIISEQIGKLLEEKKDSNDITNNNIELKDTFGTNFSQSQNVLLERFDGQNYSNRKMGTV